MAAVSSIAGSSIMYLRAMCLTAGGILHVAPLPTMREIKRNGSVMNYHIAPYASTLLNHSINGYYAFVRGDPALMTHRTAGVIANLCYIYFYLSYCPPTRMPEAKRFLTRVVIIFSAMMTVLHVLLPMLGKTKYFFNTLATFGAFTGIGLAASLLVTIVRFCELRTALAHATYG
ncbi:hypothetical protein EON67_00820 [archaeon]|nr:MAG: hypothetical protein EON67_00820 [archaeon]